METDLSKKDKFNIYLGFIFIIMYCTPVSKIILRNIPGLNALITFKFSPYYSFIYFHFLLDFLLNAVFIFIILKKLNIFERLHSGYSNTTLFILGNIIMVINIIIAKILCLFPKIDVFTYILDKINCSILLDFSKLVLLIACIKVFIGMEPYSKNND